MVEAEGLETLTSACKADPKPPSRAKPPSVGAPTYISITVFSRQQQNAKKRKIRSRPQAISACVGSVLLQLPTMLVLIGPLPTFGILRADIVDGDVACRHPGSKASRWRYSFIFADERCHDPLLAFSTLSRKADHVSKIQEVPGAGDLLSQPTRRSCESLSPNSPLTISHSKFMNGSPL